MKAVNVSNVQAKMANETKKEMKALPAPSGFSCNCFNLSKRCLSEDEEKCLAQQINK
jgi:hypothetical protein